MILGPYLRSGTRGHETGVLEIYVPCPEPYVSILSETGGPSLFIRVLRLLSLFVIHVIVSK